ncbi:hypothetical protein Tco_1092556 [Tanacetum coccineum]|uniref:Uncharacterized protein n=1 Tax=Tanacetum coccineum TaxID=301880 RepID=A0ABQ5IA71_9ASTR
MTLFGGVTYSPTAPDTELELLEAPSKTEEPRSLSPTSAPPSPDYTPATLHTDDESEPFETSKTRVTSPHFTTSPADPISPPSPQRPPLTQTSPAHTPPRAFTHTHNCAAANDIVPLNEHDTKPSTTSYEVGKSSRSTLDQHLDLTIIVGTPASLEWSLESPSVSLVIPSSVDTPAPAAALDEDALLKIWAQLELQWSQRQLMRRSTNSVSGLGAWNECWRRLGLPWVPYGD